MRWMTWRAIYACPWKVASVAASSPDVVARYAKSEAVAAAAAAAPLSSPLAPASPAPAPPAASPAPAPPASPAPTPTPADAGGDTPSPPASPDAEAPAPFSEVGWCSLTSVLETPGFRACKYNMDKLLSSFDFKF